MIEITPEQAAAARQEVKRQRRALNQKRRAQQLKNAQKNKKRPQKPAVAATDVPVIPPTQDPAPHNHTAYVVAGGPSLKGFDWSLLDDKFTVGINRTYEVIPTADITYFTDEDFYQRHIKAMKKHKGRLIKGCINLGTQYDPRVERFHLSAAAGLVMTPGKLAHGRNSTYAVLNMLTQWKFKTIYIMGADMKWGEKGKKNTSHWHDGHKRVDGEATYKGFIANFTKLAPLLKKQGVEVISINSDTNLKVFPIQTYKEHFGDNCFSP